MSLHRLLRKGKILETAALTGPDSAFYSELLEAVKDSARSPDTILVDITSVVEDLTEERPQGSTWILKTADLPICTPPYRSLWLEASGAFACHVFRDETPEGFTMVATMFEPFEGSCAGPTSSSKTTLRRDGTVEEIRLWLANHAATPGGPEYSSCTTRTFAAIQALGRMNCRNVHLEPILQGKDIPHFQGTPIPASVWHRIVIDGADKMITSGKDALGRDPKLIRSHWVRGHYADYREHGLFGRSKSKGIYWIPEYKRGNEQLGQVIPEYAIA